MTSAKPRAAAIDGIGRDGGASASAGDVADYDGLVMTEADLPPTDTRRWVMRRKAEVVAGVRVGLISLEEACRRYNLSVEEFLSWQRLVQRYGLRGLRATRIQDYRHRPAADGKAVSDS